MKRNYTISLDEEVWQRLKEMARERGEQYQGRPSRSAVIEQLVRGIQPATNVAPEPVRVAASTLVLPPVVTRRQALTLADVVARWPVKTQVQWDQDEWKARRWVQQVLDTINEMASP